MPSRRGLTTGPTLSGRIARVPSSTDPVASARPAGGAITHISESARMSRCVGDVRPLHVFLTRGDTKPGYIHHVVGPAFVPARLAEYQSYREMWINDSPRARCGDPLPGMGRRC